MILLLCAVGSMLIGATSVTLFWSRNARDLAHEVRRPLTAILLASESVRGLIADAELNALQQQAKRAGEFLEGGDPLARLKRASGWGAVVETQRARLDEALEGLLCAWAPAARSLGRNIRFENVDGQLGRSLVEAGSLDHSVGNLIANALEHGEGEVVVRASQSGSSKSTIEVLNSSAAHAWGRRTVSGGRARRGRGQRLATAEMRRHGGTLVKWSQATGSARLEFRTPEKLT
mgnify:CR=1 FL=1